MKTRCNNSACGKYKRYGGRGISIFPEWERDFQSFYDWAMSNGYEEYLTIDRIDNDGDYCPDNCRWITAREQASNKSSNHLITFGGETHTIAEWARILGISRTLLKDRITRYGWTVERAFTSPPRPHKTYKNSKRSEF